MKVKKKILYQLAIGAVALISAVSCDSCKSASEQAEEAAVEACDCIKSKSLNTCKEEIEKNYSRHLDDDFISTFNSVNKCGIKLYKTSTKANSTKFEDLIMRQR